MKKQRKKPNAKSGKPASTGNGGQGNGGQGNGGQGAVVAVVLGVGGYFSVSTVMARVDEQDLSRIGNGTPSIVQVHDSSCPLCNALQRETRKALRGFDDGQLEYMVANLNTLDGSSLAAEHGATHVTLLLFDGDGGLSQVLRGANDRDFLQAAFAAHLIGN